MKRCWCPLKKTIVLKFRIIPLLFTFLFSIGGKAQENHLTKRVTLNAGNWPISRVLSSIETQGKFYFSYDSEIIPGDSVVNFKVEGEKVAVVLRQILPPVVDFKSVGNHVVIFKPIKKGSGEVVITGYIRDLRSNKPIPNATLYDPQQNLMTASNAAGYYEMTIANPAEKLGLTVSKSGYRQEVVYVIPQAQSQLDFKLMNLEKPVSTISPRQLEYPDVNERKIVRLVVPDRVIENSNNLALFEQVPVQLSVVPGVSTSGLLNASSTNHFSLNLLAGYSQGTEGMELGGLVNINRKDMNGVQLAGVANVTGRFMYGAQVSGMFNYNGLLFEGAQVSGMSNINAGDMKGVQVASFSNILNGEMDGAQICGFSNFTTESVDGAQIAGFLNIAARDVEMAQVSGFMNYSQNIRGLQLAGFLNVAAREVEAAQLSGYLNYAETVGGIQMAGFANVTRKRNAGLQLTSIFNYSGSNEGVQLAFINFADSSSGVPIGFLSIVSKGYHTVEVSATELFPVNLAVKTGVTRFYNIFEGGANQEDFHLTYGLGTMPSLGRKWHLSLDLTASAIFNSDNPQWEQKRYLFRFTPSLNYQPFKNFGIAIGPSLNYFMADFTAEGLPTPLVTYATYESTANGLYEQAWIGGRIGLRFF